MKILNKISTHLFGILLLCAISFMSCSRDDDPAPRKEKQTNVYVAGNQLINKTVVWKNGQIAHSTDNPIEIFTQSIFVSGTDVYTAGYEQNSSDISVAKAWKNGNTLHTLNDASV